MDMCKQRHWKAPSGGGAVSVEAALRVLRLCVSRRTHQHPRSKIHPPVDLGHPPNTPTKIQVQAPIGICLGLATFYNVVRPIGEWPKIFFFISGLWAFIPINASSSLNLCLNFTTLSMTMHYLLCWKPSKYRLIYVWSPKNENWMTNQEGDQFLHSNP